MKTYRPGATFNYRAKDGACCGVRVPRMRSGYAVVIDWPAGAQDFPSVLRAGTLDALQPLIRRAHLSVVQAGDIPESGDFSEGVVVAINN